MSVRSVAALALVLGAQACAVAPAEQPTAERIREAADSLLEPLHARGDFNGAVVLGRDGEELYARGFGLANAAAVAPFTPDTPADGGSIAKTFTAAAIHMLAEEGRFSLDDPVRKHVAEYPHAETRVRHLLAHSAGLPEAEYDFFEGLLPADSVRTTAMLVRVLRDRKVPPAFPPGTRFRYSSLGYDVAALVVERVSGKSYEAFLRERVFEPLRMGASFLRPARLADWRGVRTLSYRRAGDTLAVHDVFDREGFYGGSNLYFSARDLDRWSQSFYAGPVLSEAALARGHEVPMIGAGRSALDLLGWYHHPTARRYHYSGALQGFWGSVYRDEDRRYSVVYLSNNGMPQWLRPLLTRALIEVMEGRRPAPIVRPAFAELGKDGLPRAAGCFAVDRVGDVAMEERERRLFLRIEDGIEYPAFPLGGGQLYVPGLDVWLGFPADGRFERLAWLSVYEVSEGRRLPCDAGGGGRLRENR